MLRNFINFLTLNLFLVSFFINCLTFKESELDPNSVFNQLITWANIKSALQPREIRLKASALNVIKSNEPYFNVLATVRKMPESYFTDYSEGDIETTEGVFVGTYLADANGEIEIVLELGLGKYRIDFYGEGPSGLLIIHSQLLNIQSFNQSINSMVISKSNNNLLSLNWNELKFPLKSLYSFYSLFSDGDVNFVGEKNGRAFYTGKLIYPNDIEFKTQPSFTLTKFKTNVFLAYTDDGINWNSIVLKETPIITNPANNIFLRGSFMAENEIIFIFTEEVVSNPIKIHKYRIPLQNPSAYSFSSYNYNSSIPDFNNLGIINNKNYLYAGGLIYEERNSSNVPTFFITFDFFETPGTVLNNSDFNSPFEINIVSQGNIAIHNGSLARIYHNSGDQGSIKFMSQQLNQFNGFGYTLANPNLGGSVDCRLNSISIYCMESNGTFDQARFSANVISFPFNEPNVTTVPNASGISFSINSNISQRGEISTADTTLISYNTSPNYPALIIESIFRIQHNDSSIETISPPSRYLSNDFMIHKAFLIENGMGTRSGDFLQLTREINYFLDGSDRKIQRQPYLTTTRSTDGRNWTTPVRVDIKPPRPKL
jgi:hypothetical protein